MVPNESATGDGAAGPTEDDAGDAGEDDATDPAPEDAADRADAVAGMAAPDDRPRETMDVRSLPPPEPMERTLERLAEADDDLVLVQRNDRAPQHLYPVLDERGYRYETVEGADAVVTAIWREMDGPD